MGLSFSLDNVGPLARTVRDCARILRIIAGEDSNDATASSEPVEDYELCTINPESKGLKIGVPTNYYYDYVSEEVRELLNSSLKEYEQLGAHIVEVNVPDHEKLTHLAHVVMGSEAATLHGAWLDHVLMIILTRSLREIQPGLSFPSTRYLHALQIRPEITKRFVEQVFGACDVLHAPVLSFPTPKILDTDIKAAPGFEELLGQMSHCTRPINYLGLPSLAVPAGFTSNGLPTSFPACWTPI